MSLTSQSGAATGRAVRVGRPTTRRAFGFSAAALAAPTAIALAAWLMSIDMRRELNGAVALALLLVLCASRVPIAAAMGIAGGLGMYCMVGAQALRGTLGDLPFLSASGYSLTVLPMFIFMGLMLWRAGVTEDLYAAVIRWFGWVPGGLAVTTNVVGAGLATVSGSTAGITYALTRIGIPEMLRAGYDRRLAVGSVLVAGTIGQIIPPSVLLVVYASFAEVPIGPQLLAGIVPGLLLASTFCVLIVSYSMARPRLSPRVASSYPAKEKLSALGRAWPIPAMILIVIGGLYLGVFTATEAGAFGALLALLVAILRVPLSGLGGAIGSTLRETLSAVGSIFFLLLGAAILGRFLALSGAATWLADQLVALGIGRLSLIATLVLLYLLLGMFMEPLSMILLTVPVLLPVAVEFGISPIWFGVFVVLMGEVGILTPPIGMLTFIVHRLVQNPAVNLGHEISLKDTFVGAMWLLPAPLVVVGLMAFFPDLVELLPQLAAGSD